MTHLVNWMKKTWSDLVEISDNNVSQAVENELQERSHQIRFERAYSQYLMMEYGYHLTYHDPLSELRDH